MSEFIAATLLLLFSSQAYGQSINQPAAETPPDYGWREAWTGVDAAHDQWLIYSGLTVAPVSRDIYSDGWRIRIGGGYGQYSYDGLSPRPACGDATKNDACTENGRKAQRYKVNRTYAEVLVGYYLRLGALTAKAFAGASMSNERHVIDDPVNHDDGTDYGVKGALEFWLNLSDDTWTSLDLSYATARNETASRWRAGWIIKPHVSIGPELRY
ncbi:MAG TPA: cellulose biosynthesis protein BcsS, partial [Lacipirellulaceae bacterium]|nr:cellulose biosynthesis protein BcsS [Lacipirellulaceae bacterium]